MRGEPGRFSKTVSSFIHHWSHCLVCFFFLQSRHMMRIHYAQAWLAFGSDDEKIVAGPMRKLVDVDFGPPPLPRRSGGDHPGGKRDATILHDQVVASDLQPTLFRLTVERIISRIKCFLRKITASHLNLLQLYFLLVKLLCLDDWMDGSSFLVCWLLGALEAGTSPENGNGRAVLHRLQSETRRSVYPLP